MATKAEINEFIEKEIVGKDETFIEKVAERVVARFKITYPVAVSMVWVVFTDLNKNK